MDRKIGSYFLLAAFLWNSSVLGVRDEKAVSLRVIDPDGSPLKQACMGIPFLIEVEVLASGRGQDIPQLTVPEDIQAVRRGTSNSVQSINGKTTVRNRYTYQAVADHEGVFTIGPAIITTAQGQQRSNTVTLTVGIEQKRMQSAQRLDAFVVLKVATEQPYVGQAVPFTIRFYYTDESAHLEQLQEPTFKDFKHTPLEGPVTGTATVDGVSYQYLEWRATLFPVREGRVVIPSLLAYATIPVKQPHSRMDMFSLVNQMFGSGRTEQLYSNALTLQVKPLPEHEPSVVAVGKFTSFHSKLSATQVATGEGVTLALELVGEGNFQMIGHPVLSLPEGLKYYDSHAKEHPLTDTMVKKDFEYVVQAVQPGTYEIPAQAFEYFDIKTGSYKTLYTRPVTLTAQGVVQKGTREEHASKEEKETDVSDAVPPLETTIRGGGPVATQGLSFLLFLCITILLAFPLLWRFGVVVMNTYYLRNASSISHNRAFSVARSRVKNAQKTKDHESVYHIFMDLLSIRLEIPRAEISEASIESALRKAGCSEEQIQEWRHFFSHLMAITFSALPEEGDLYEQAHQWLMILEQIV